MSRAPKRIAVFCSAGNGLRREYHPDAEAFADAMVARGCELIYGGSRTGLMGCFANRILAKGGVARGATTASLASSTEHAHQGLSELLIVEDLFARKRWFMEQGDAFVIFPGGLGTLDEALEVITWKALGCHNKPILFVNLKGFWQHQIETFENLAERGMIRPGGLELYHVCNSLDEAWTVLDGAGFTH